MCGDWVGNKREVCGTVSVGCLDDVAAVGSLLWGGDRSVRGRWMPLGAVFGWDG